LIGTDTVGKKYTIEHDCIYDNKAPANKDSLYGKYEEILLIKKNKQNSFDAAINYFSVSGANFPQYAAGIDKGSGTGYVSGDGNNFTIFCKVKNALYENIPYDALWIISGTVSDTLKKETLRGVTKSLLMLGKGNDPKDKVAKKGTIRIFKDVSSELIQPDVIISNFSPTSGPYSTIVTINGSGFSANKAENIVKFNGVNATVLEATTSKLIVEVPKKAGTGPVTVQVNNNTGTGKIFTYISTYTVSTLAGTGQPGSLDGIASRAQFNSPSAVAANTQGIIYVADSGNERIRMITPAGVVSTPWTQFDVDGSFFSDPSGIAVDAQGNVYVADVANQSIDKVTPAGDFIDIGLFPHPYGVAVDTKGNIYVAETENVFRKSHSIIIITPQGKPSLLAGNGQAGFLDGIGSKAQFNNPRGIAVDAQGNIYVADMGNDRIRKITPAGVVSTLAGPNQFNNPEGVAVDAQGNVYVADIGKDQILQITPTGMVSVVAGNGQAGFLDGIGSKAQFNNPSGVAVDAQGILYVADSQNHRIRKIVLE
jgi:sugar lactone lactonase YvrE